MLNSNQILESLQNCSQGYLKPDHILFTESNINLLQQYKKLGAISNKDVNFANAANSSNKQIFCNEFGCSAVFEDICSYQSHYNVVHRFICVECKKPLPTNHLLDLHLSEHHDSYFKARIDRGERLFKCYLEECRESFGNFHERKEHCIKQHKFPVNFRFDQIGAKNFLTRKDTSEKEWEPDGFPADLEKRNCKIPGLKNISFGHQKEKTFDHRNSSRQNRETGTTLEDMNTLKQALESV